MNVERNTLLRVQNLKKYFPVSRQLFRTQRRYVIAVDDVSFDVYGGEILGIAGISGNGQKELLEAIAGLQHT